MFPSNSLLSIVTLALGACISTSATPLLFRRDDAKPGVNALSFYSKFAQHPNGTFGIVDADLARIKHMIGHAQHLEKTNGTAFDPKKRAAHSFSVTNAAITYTASVGVGNPATSYTLVIDTGSSNTWIGAHKKYTASATSVNTGNAVSVSYGSGMFAGREFLDRVTLSPQLVIKQQSIGVATTAMGFDGVDGILGVGPTDLTSGTVSNTDTVPTVTDNLYTQHSVSSALLSVYFQPTTSQSARNGELTFGGVDASKYTGKLTYAPLTRTAPAKYYWGVDQRVTYGNGTAAPVLDTTAGIIDTGTTLIYLASDAFAKYAIYTGGVPDAATGLLRITPAQYARLHNLNFVIGGRALALPPNGQIFPRALNSLIGGSPGHIYLVVSDLGSPSGDGLDFINGYAFLTRFLTVYDTRNERVGFATTRYTNAVMN